MTLDDVARSVSAARHNLAAREGRVALLRDQSIDARARVQSLQDAADLAGKVHAVLAGVSEALREEVKRTVEVLVESALQAVFGERIYFRFDVAVKRGVVNLKPTVGYGATREVATYRSVADSVGGGVVDVTSFALRVAVVMLHRPKLRPVLFADESFKHVSVQYRPRVAEMLSRLAAETGLQIIMVSHEEVIAAAADKVFTVSMEGGVSTVEDQGAP